MPRPGQVLGLVGTNGIGKSTALKVLAGKLKPNLGRFDVSLHAQSKHNPPSPLSCLELQRRLVSNQTLLRHAYWMTRERGYHMVQ